MKQSYLIVAALLFFGMILIPIPGFSDSDNEKPDNKIDLYIAKDLSSKTFSITRNFKSPIPQGNFSATFNSQSVTIDVDDYFGVFTVEVSHQKSPAALFESFSVRGGGTYRVNTSRLPAGIYIIQITTEHGTYQGRFTLD